MHIKGLILKVVVAVYGIFAFFSLGFAQSQGFLADRHASYGASCQSCHGVAQPQAGATVDYQNCLQCHKSYEALAARTPGQGGIWGVQNPHDNHYVPNLHKDCSLCHKGHQPSKDI